MLKQRIITASVLAPLALASLFYLPLPALALCFAGIILLGAWEWAPLAGLTERSYRWVLVVGVALLMAVIWFGSFAAAGQVLLPLAFVLLFLSFVWVKRFPEKGVWSRRPVGVVLCLVLLTAAWWSLLELRQEELGSQWLLLVLLIVWGADIGAYVAGKSWGRNKLVPRVSPGKTKEGFWGGVATVLLVVWGFSWFNELSTVQTLYLMVLGGVVAMVSVLGDLLESMLKRHAGIKDSGTLLPGHGGVLDRIDSLIAAAPVYLFGLHLLPVI